MKTILNYLAIASVALILTSCTTTFYQVYKTEPLENIVASNKALLFEDDNCRVSYNLWEDGGNAGFLFYNKTDQEISINLEKSFFIINGIAKDYYQDRIFTSSNSSVVSTSKSGTASKSVAGINTINLWQKNSLQYSTNVGAASSSGYSTAYKEPQTIIIPSKTSKIISEFNINNALVRDCDLFRYPSKNEVKSITFNQDNSPIVFSNRILYTVGTAEPVSFENKFYVTEITNYPENEMLESVPREYCGQKSSTKRQVFKNVSADKFYVKYLKGTEIWKH